jgi:hypothetical protein
MALKNQREQLMHTMIGQITIMAMVAIVIWIYVIPDYISLSASVVETNTIIEKFKQTTDNGIPYPELSTILQATKWKEELLAIMQSTPKETQDVMLKVWSESYMSWLNSAIGASSSDKKKLAIKKARLNSILPTLNPISNNLMEETVSMRKYISFIEENILKQFGIESTASLGIQNIRYGKRGTMMPEVLGSFDTEIAFVSTNLGISKMIDYVNTLGHYDLLLETGATSTGSTGIMSNPLAMIDSLSLQTTLDLNKPNDENTGRMVIRFYIRGSSITDIAYLGETIKSRKEAFKKKIDAAILKCNTDITCSGKKNLELLNRKYSEFVRATSQNTNRAGTEMIYILSSELNSIVSLEKEMTGLTK